MKKVLALVLFAVALTSCDNLLEEVAEDNKNNTEFKIFNDKLKGSKGGDAPQNQGSGSGQTNNQSKPKEQQ